MRKTTIIMIVIDILVAICFFVFYGPFKSFRNNLISTAMITKSHQYIAHIFYSEDTIQKVMAEGQFVPISETVNLDDIVIDTSEKDSYDNEFDEEILTREPGNEDYKHLKIKVGKTDAHLIAIYDSSKVKLISSKAFNTGNGQETVLQMCKRSNGSVCINGGGFVDSGYGSDIPIGAIIKNNKIIWDSTGTAGNLIGFTNDNKLLLINATAKEAITMGMRDALEFGPFLIVNGKSPNTKDNGGGYARASRVVIAQRKDGVVLFLVTEGTHGSGPTLNEVIDTLKKYGAYNAANLDGGTSASLVIKNKLINNPITVLGEKIYGGRYVVSGFGLLLNGE